jgi:transposase-like protein
MSKRLQVLLDEAEFREIRRIARRYQVTVAEWVRQALRAARRKEPSADLRRKLDVLGAAVAHEGPTGDIDRMLAEIEQGYLGKAPK